MTAIPDVFRATSTQNINVGSTTVNSSTPFDTQTYWIRLCMTSANSTSAGFRYIVDKAPVVTSASGTLVPNNWPEYVRVTPGFRVSCTGVNDATTSVNVVELSY